MKDKINLKKSLVLLGGGGHCLSCVDVIYATRAFEIKGIVLPNETNKDEKEVHGLKIIGQDNDLPDLIKDFSNFFISVGQIKSPEARIRLFDLLKKLNAKMPSIKSPLAYVSPNSNISEGSIVMHGAIVNSEASVGSNCILNTQSLVEHGVKIEDHCHISTGAKINGNAKIKSGSFVGSGAIIREGITIGNRCVIGAGVSVFKNIPDGAIITR